MNLKKGLKKYEKLSRDEYFKKNQELSENLWETSIPTVTDIADFVENKENENTNKIFEFFENKEEFTKMTQKTDDIYDQETSSAFIRKVMASNNADIAKAGYFYKLLMASADDLILSEDSCNSKGITINVKDITPQLYNYRIKFMFVEELDTFVEFLDVEDFINCLKEKNIETITVRHPLDCELLQSWENCKGQRCICPKCAGLLPPRTKNVGTFTTLMVTESATQDALSSMNKGRKENINDLLMKGYQGSYTLESIKEWIKDIVDCLDISENPNVASRFYEIALMSRIRFDKDGPFVSSLKGSINHSGNLFGSYIFTPNNKNFEKIVKERHFIDNSLKLKIATNNFDD